MVIFFYSNANRLWEPVPDEIYLQETRQKISLDKPVTSLAEFNNQWILEVCNNDGGHTATYLAAMSFKYAVTGDIIARYTDDPILRSIYIRRLERTFEAKRSQNGHNMLNF